MKAGYIHLQELGELAEAIEQVAHKKHSHYFKPCPYDEIDIYRVLEIFNVTDPVLQHIAKKALCAGNRGHKDFRKDVRDIFDSAKRKLDMLDEDMVLCSELK